MTPTQESFSSNTTTPFVVPLPPSSEDCETSDLNSGNSMEPTTNGTMPARCAQKPGAKVWTRLYQAKYKDNTQATVAKLRNVITQLIGANRATDIIISPPTADETLYKRYAQSWHLLISGLSVEATELLTSLAVCTTADVTCFFVPFKQPLPTYICTIENLTFQDSARSNLLIAELVQKTLQENTEVSDFINSHVIAPTAKTAQKVIYSIQVSSLNIATSRSSMLTVWNIYCDAPRFSLEDYYLWSALIRGLRFPSDNYGTGVPRLQDKQFTCTGCKSFDHPTGLCPFPATPGWLGPTNAVTKEDLSMTTFDTHPNNRGPQGGSNINKRGLNRVRGTRSHGSQGPRGGFATNLYIAEVAPISRLFMTALV
ncbi:hypothetical protein C8R48DRAFT_674022 [Suillus tomentosus]|nr:hypothetical protein C8R48DRAFT_674022 [Suillus tomentosus]